MKLLTHNILTSKILKNVVNGYPLQIVATKVEMKSADFQPEFIKRMMKKVDYKALFEAANTLGHGEGLPNAADFNEEHLNSEDLVKKLHQVLMEVEVMEGDLICPETGRKFPIQNGIPNMLLNEDETN